MLREKAVFNKAALKDHKGPVVSHSESHRLSAATSPMIICSMALVPLFPLDEWKTLVPTLSCRAEGPFCFQLGGGGGMQRGRVRQRAPNRREHPRMPAAWRQSIRRDTLESYRELPSI